MSILRVGGFSRSVSFSVGKFAFDENANRRGDKKSNTKKRPRKKKCKNGSGTKKKQKFEKDKKITTCFDFDLK